VGPSAAARAVKIFFQAYFTGKCVSAPPGHEVHPQPQQESFLGQLFDGRVRFGDIFRRSLRATTKKRSSTILAKSAPQTKSWLRLWDRLSFKMQDDRNERLYIPDVSNLFARVQAFVSY